jgi:nibrin
LWLPHEVLVSLYLTSRIGNNRQLTAFTAIATLTDPPSRVVASATVEAMDVDDGPANSMAAPVPPARRVGRSRRTITSRFKGFDDDFDMPSLPESIPYGQGQAPAAPQTQGLFVSQSQYSEPVQQSPESVTGRTRSSRKRPSEPPIEQEEDDGDVLDQLAPAATNLKRRRLADELARKRKGEPSPPRPAVAEPVTNVLTSKKKKIKPEIDILEVARQRREKEEEIERAEREALQEAMDGMDIDKIQNLAIIEEMDVKRTVPPPGASAHGDEGVRWDDRWNGRKNFKKFRRKGEGGPRVLNKVIVPLEEVKKKDFGIGDEYWLEGDKDTTKKKKGKGRIRETQSQSVGISQSQAAPVRRQAENTQAAEETGSIDPPTPSQRATRSQKLSGRTNISPNRPSQNKRAAEPMTKPATAKKARQAPRRHDSDDSDDGLGFRFRKKK